MKKLRRKIQRLIRIARFFKNWPIILLRYTRYMRDRPLTCILRNGVKFKIGSVKPIGVILNIYGGRFWNPKGYEIEPGDIVIDIGAHIGSFSVLAATSALGVNVFSYEPEPMNFNLLTENIRLNNLSCVKPFPLAVVGKQGKAELLISRSDIAHSTANTKSDAYISSIEVGCITLKEILDRVGKCDFLKINCEGAEYEILFGTPREYLRRIYKMVVDCHPIEGYSVNSLKDYLKDAGFQIEQAYGPKSSIGDGLHVYLYA